MKDLVDIFQENESAFRSGMSSTDRAIFRKQKKRVAGRCPKCGRAFALQRAGNLKKKCPKCGFVARAKRFLKEKFFDKQPRPIDVFDKRADFVFLGTLSRPEAMLVTWKRIAHTTWIRYREFILACTGVDLNGQIKAIIQFEKDVKADIFKTQKLSGLANLLIANAKELHRCRCHLNKVEAMVMDSIFETYVSKEADLLNWFDKEYRGLNDLFRKEIDSFLDERKS